MITLLSSGLAEAKIMKAYKPFLCWFLAWLMLVAPSAAVRAQAVAEEDTATLTEPIEIKEPVILNTPNERNLPGTRPDTTLLADPAIVPVPDVIDTPLDVSYLLPQSCFVLSVRPRAILNAPTMQLMPLEVLQAASIQHTGIDALLMDRVLLSVEPPAAGPPNFAVMASFTAPVADKVLPSLLTGLERNAESERPHYRSKPSDVAAFTPSLYFPGDNVALVTFESTLQKFLLNSTKPTDSSLHDRLMAAKNDDLYAAVDFVPLRPFVNALLMQNPIPPQLHYFYTAPDLIKTIELRVNISHQGVTEFVVEANNTDDAEKLEQIFIQTADLFKAEIAKESERLLKDPEPVQQALGRYQQRLMNELTTAYMPKREGDRLNIFRYEGNPSQATTMGAVYVSGVLVALLLPAVQASREAARRSQSMNNVKQILLAMLNHHDARKSFPAHANYSADGKPLLSWRVHILPYLEQQALYNQFHLDEPWDSEHNKQLIAQMPLVYLDPSSGLSSGEGRTHYLGVKGPGMVFNGTKDGVSLREIKDGTSNTIAVLQVNNARAATWTKPDDWELDEKNPMVGLSNSVHFVAGFCDGHILMLSESIDLPMFKGMLTIGGGEQMP
jgi:hypothetical protein